MELMIKLMIKRLPQTPAVIEIATSRRPANAKRQQVERLMILGVRRKT